MKKELTYNDISLFSRQISKIKSRFSNEIDTTVKVKFGSDIKNVGFLMSAPMYDVTCELLQIKLLELGQLPIVHRFMSADEQISTLYNVVTQTNFNEDYIYSYSIGINDYKEKLIKLNTFINGLDDEYKLNFLICIDTANGASFLLEEPIFEINKLKELYKNKCNIEILTGNVVTKEACRYLYCLGVKFIRCGISSGSVCSTSVVTGIYRPPVSMLLEIDKWKDDNNINDLYIIADGGIKGTDDMLKAIACGANFIMSGRLFAGYEESNGSFVIEHDLVTIKPVFAETFTTKIKKIDRSKKYYRGMASQEMAELNNKVNSLNKNILVEGVSDFVDFKHNLNKDVETIVNSIKSSMSYVNANNFFDYICNVEIIEITDNSNFLRKPENYNKK